MQNNWILLLVAFIFSAFFSGVETALISARRIQVEIWKKKKKAGSKQALHTLRHPETYLVTTLVGNNIAMVTTSSLMALYLEPYFSGIVITLITATILLIAGEILPKSFARDKASSMLLWSSNILHVIYILLYPFIYCITGFSQFLLKMMGIPKQDLKSFFSRKDMELLIHESDIERVVGQEEKQIISRMVLKGNLKVKDIMIPRTEIIGMSISESVKDAVQLFEKSGISRLVLFGDDLDEVVGMIHAKDILLQEPESLVAIQREILFVPETLNIGECLEELRSKEIRMAIVVDEYGGTAGLVTLEDIIEEYLGDILDEFDNENQLIRNRTENNVEIHARIEIGEFNEFLSLNIPQGDYQTLGGYILDRLGKIPRTGETFQFPFGVIKVVSATKKRINWIQIKLKKTEI